MSGSNNNLFINNNNTQSSERGIIRVNIYSKEPSIKYLYFDEFILINNCKSKNDLLLTKIFFAYKLNQ